MPNVYARTLKSAARLVGGDEELAHRLDVSGSDLAAWAAGCGVPPIDALLKAVDLLANGVAPSPQSTSWKFCLRAALSSVSSLGTGIAARRMATPRR